ncbi:MAG: 2-oxoacid:ferredoxin oxidoreductase subunit beta, partial [Bacteroidales bacterium]|nr:2-oxoacid:ferredoxin oxidoreductase subunit beta [Bacteroidales bacterium]
PYYMNTYGFHGIHGRATALSTGIKVANPLLTVWQACGDGDALAIGGNHFIHAIRRNIDINIIVFNNQIYGLTKGQYSPTSKFGAITKTSPYGTVEHPFTPGMLVLGARGTFFARGIDTDIKLNQEIFVAAAKHDGTSVCEMLTNCVIFNNGAHAAFTAREEREDRTITLRDGEKMVFGKNRDKGLILKNGKLQVVKIGENSVTMDDILTHHSGTLDYGIHSMLIDMKYPDFPVALGVIRDVADRTYDDSVRDQLIEVTEKSKIHCMDDLLHSGSTWEVE